MPAPKASLLFHPKKKKPTAGKPTNGVIVNSPPKPVTRPPPRPKPQENDELDSRAQLPTSPFTDYKLVSTTLEGWKYDVMKLESRKPVKLEEWPRPVKLNRKEPRRGDDSAGPSPQVPVQAMLGPDGKPVIGADGRIVMLDADGRPIHNTQNGSQEKEKPRTGPKKFQKKTRQVFLVPEATRQLRKEERYPWVMEDSTGREVWVGQMEEVAKSETHALLVPSEGNQFKFVPAHRWYKFQKRPHYKIPDLEEAEALMSQIQKNKDPERWLLARRNGQGPSSATAAVFKAEAEGRTLDGSLVYNSQSSLGPGGRKLRAVDREDPTLFGGDDEVDGDHWKRKRDKELGGEGDLDELDFEETFADDEEKMDADDKEDEEAKELEERLKREYKTANKTREGYVDDSDDDIEDPALRKQVKDMKKLLVGREGAEDYESDEEGNPYASEDEEEEEEKKDEPISTMSTGPAAQAEEDAAKSRAETPASKPDTPRGRNGSLPNSRATSPVGHGGHSIVAKRATSPKAPKLKTNGGSRATSPLAGSASRATSPVASGSRAGSPVAQSPSGPRQGNKRKADDGVSAAPSPGAGGGDGTGGQPKAKKRKAVGELNEQMVVDWLKATPTPKIRDCISHFTPYLSTPEIKKRFTQIVKEVARVRDGQMVLKPRYANGSSAPSPSPVPAEAS
ncbi:hypothetical protein PUNSTDRAFT_51226 [Punctularia strigosozonata HHB-11173 SS5]|uniref:uncharacterized protein n=1 Tax=Punctularia strigosozonata (strain HHB-11173) TaxID=741275 RepID=UPI0004416833|nr:uncharacterized protein PUNSTDRAFT_51226 [Punctularia strigosozonata HHB-11173 SS5]EIN10618.1 hypothetical protein PUNSTDRAFT_51226 [Punctularia strigosozonata HHB-11173 SS5]